MKESEDDIVKKIKIIPDSSKDREIAEQMEFLINSTIGDFPIRFVNPKLYDADGNELHPKCACGNDAHMSFIGVKACFNLCSECAKGE